MREHRLTPHQHAVSLRALAEESAQRAHLIVHISGAHAYGFPSPDSDVDIKAVHIAPTAALLGLQPPPPVANRLEIIDGVEIDYTSNELLTCIRGLLRGDGNMLERVTSRAHLGAAPQLEGLADHAYANLSLRYHHHYFGFARSQHKRVLQSERPSAKRALYVLRTALTGVHLLRERVCEPDLTRLHAQYGFPEVDELIVAKQGGETHRLSAEWERTLPAILERAFDLLATAREHSGLPQDAPPSAAAALEGWLLDLRRAL